MLVGALLAGASNAVAVGVDEAAPVPVDDLNVDVGAADVGGPVNAVHELVPSTRPTVDAVTGAVSDIVEQAFACRTAVRIDMTWWGGTIGDVRNQHRNFLLADAVAVGTTTTQVPLYETITQTIWEPTGAVRSVAQVPLLGGALEQILEPILEPITKTTTTLVGYREVVSPVLERTDYAVDVAWQLTRIDWTREVDTVYLTLAAGSPWLANGEGIVVQICDPEIRLLSAEPSPNWGAYDTWSVLPKPASAWYVDILRLSVSLAQAEDYEHLAFQNWGVHAPPSSVVSAVDRARMSLAVDADDAEAQKALRPSNAPATEVQAAPEVTTQSEGTRVNTSNGMFALLGTVAALGLALVGAVGRYAWLRLR